MNFPSGQYGVVYCDPPWLFENFSEKGEGKNPSAHYPCMSMAELKAMRDQVLFASAPNCVCFMWATFPMLPEALQLMECWGFKYKSGAAWHKKTKHGKTAFGTGYIFRSAAELLLVGTNGEPRARNKSTRNIIESPVREHSRKPDETVTMIEKLFHGPYLELFARTQREGWTTWGNQTDKFAGAA